MLPERWKGYVMRDAIWWVGAEISELSDVIKIEASTDKVIFTFPTGIATDKGRDQLHDITIDLGYFMYHRAEDKPGEVTIVRDRPQAHSYEFISESDIFEPNAGCGGSRRLIVRGFGLLLLIRSSMDEPWFVEEVQLKPREHMYQWESGAYFWYDYLHGMAKEYNINVEDLQYRFASMCNFNDLNFGER